MSAPSIAFRSRDHHFQPGIQYTQHMMMRFLSPEERIPLQKARYRLMSGIMVHDHIISDRYFVRLNQHSLLAHAEC